MRKVAVNVVGLSVLEIYRFRLSEKCGEGLSDVVRPSEKTGTSAGAYQRLCRTFNMSINLDR